MAGLSESALDNAAHQAWLLRLAYPNKTAAEVGQALKAFYVELDAAQLARVLKHDGGRPVFPGLTALEMGRLLLESLGFQDLDEESMSAALRAAAYPQADIASAVSRLFLPRPGTLVLSFDGTSTYIRLSKNSLSHLPSPANSGFTIDVWIYPTALDDRPIVTLVYDSAQQHGGVQWQAEDLTVGLSLYGSRIRVSALTPVWDAGIPSNPRLVTVTTEATVPANAWSRITAVWCSGGGGVVIHLNEQPQRLEFQNNHEHLNNYNRNLGGMKGYVNTFVPSVHRFLFGRYKDRFFKGHMKDVSIYTGPQRFELELFQQPNGYWPLNESSGNVAQDRLGSQNHGAIQNPVWTKPHT